MKNHPYLLYFTILMRFYNDFGSPLSILRLPKDIEKAVRRICRKPPYNCSDTADRLLQGIGDADAYHR